MTPQLKSIIAHITLIGWVVALLVNSSEKDSMTSFYIRQTLGIYIIGVAGSFIPGVRLIIGLICFVLWLISLIGAIQEKETEVPVLGSYFQDWFKGI